MISEVIEFFSVSFRFNFLFIFIPLGCLLVYFSVTESLDVFVKKRLVEMKEEIDMNNVCIGDLEDEVRDMKEELHRQSKQIENITGKD